MIQDDVSPIELEIQRIANRVEKACGSSYQVCNECGEKDRGFSDMREGTFTCIKCYVKREADSLYNDPEWMKKEKVWKLRQARKDYNLRINNKIAEV